MKKIRILLTVGFVLISGMITAQSPYYYYYEGKKIYLSLNTEHAFLSLKEQNLPVDIKQRKLKTNELQSDKSDKKQYKMQKRTNRFWTELNIAEKLSDEQYLKMLAGIKSRNKDAIVSPYFKFNDGDKIGLSNFFYVKLKTASDTVLLSRIAGKTKSIIVEQDTFMPLWFVLSTTEQSEYNAMEMANIFYESGLF